MLKKGIITGVLLIGALVFGFIFLLKGCLAKYDERYADAPALYFEKDGKGVIFSIVTFEKTTSYSSGNGMTRRSVSTRYYVQSNDAVTGAKLLQHKEKHQSDIKQHPIEIMGGAHNRAWLFMGELMAFDPFTLERVADIKILEAKNPQLKGRMPAERKFYEFRRGDGNIYITAADGSKWQLNTATLTAVQKDFDDGGGDAEQRDAELDELLQDVRDKLDSLYQQKSSRAGQQLRQQEITQAEYQRLTKLYYAERELLNKEQDSLRDVKMAFDKLKRGMQDLERNLKNLERPNSGFSQMKTNTDTLNGRWAALYAPEEQKELTSDYFYHRTLYKEAARRQLYTAAYTRQANGNDMIKRTGLTHGNDLFLDGGFLLDKQTARPMRVGNSYLVVHKDKIGNEGQVLLSLVQDNGTKAFTTPTPLTYWTDWIFTGKRLIVLGTNNRKLSNGQVNLLLVIDLQNGQLSEYDFFKDK